VPTKLTQILDALENKYGAQMLVGPTNPYEMIVFLNCGYPASDAKCAKGFEELRCVHSRRNAPIFKRRRQTPTPRKYWAGRVTRKAQKQQVATAFLDLPLTPRNNGKA
jgi:hypothetical protein